MGQILHPTYFIPIPRDVNILHEATIQSLHAFIFHKMWYSDIKREH